RYALSVEWTRSLTAQALRIVGHGNASGSNLLAHHFAQKAGLARDRRAIDSAGQMAGHAARHARVEDDIHRPGPGLAGIEASDDAFAGLAANAGGFVEIRKMQP